MPDKEAPQREPSIGEWLTVSDGAPAITLRARGYCADGAGRRVQNLLSADEQRALSQIAALAQCHDYGTPIYREGEPAQFVYMLGRGAVRLGCHQDVSGRQVIGLLWPGDLFGLAEDGAYLNTACVVAPSAVYRIALDDFRRLIAHSPSLQTRLLIKAAHDLRQAQRRLVVLGRESALQRIASFFADLAGQAEMFDAGLGEISLPLRRQDIADYLGLAVETVSRGIRDLERLGVLRRLTTRLFQLSDGQMLAALAEGRQDGDHFALGRKGQ